jgi:SAM-dependent methyltransferase
VSFVARQFSGPSGVLGRFVTRLLAKGNAGFNTWLVGELAGVVKDPATVIELGSGPGIALQELARTYPAARIVGVDPSAVVQRSAHRRNAGAIAEGRLTLVSGDLRAAATYLPAELILAVHVIYFWSDPRAELRRIRDALAPGGCAALGYQLRANMPARAQRHFPEAGFTLYDSDDQITALMREAGFSSTEVRMFGSAERPGGRLALARA